MDVMRPDLYQIGTRCYRRNPVRESHQGHRRPAQQPGPYREEDETEFLCTYDEGEAEEVVGLTERSDGSWRLEMRLPSQVFPMLIGRRGETKKRVEIETRTQVRIPRQGVEGPLLVEGRERAGVLSARTRIEVLAAAAREKMPFTHFLSIPMAGPEVCAGFEVFRNQVLDLCGGDRGVEASLFQNPNKLHLTLGVMVLLNQEEVEKAGTLLQECRPALTQMTDADWLVDLAGLEYMNDDPSEVDVLYIRVLDHDSSGRLQRLADFLVDRFVDAGLMVRQYDRVKLHLTAMNTLFRKDPSGASAPIHGDARRRPRHSFDATNLLKRFPDAEVAMQVPVRAVHLSERFSVNEEGYYAAAATVQL